MTAAFIALMAVAGVSWLFRITFTAIVGADRLPEALRSRLDAVGPAAFAALLTTELVGTTPATAPAFVAAMAAAAGTAWKTGNHLLAVIAAAACWSLVSLVVALP